MRHIVALSGGKDSTALALRLRELHPDVDYEYVCTPTGDELPEMEEHWAKLEALMGCEIIRLRLYEGNGLHQIIRDEKMIPNFRARFCTRKLKIEPILEYFEKARPCVHYVGLRADEEGREGIFGSMEDVEHRFPLREWEWGINEVWDYLDRRGVSIPRRSDCALCFFQRLDEWKRLWKYNRAAFDAGVEIEERTGYTFRSPHRDTWPASLKELGEEFSRGRKVRGEEDEQQMRLPGCDKEDLCRVCTL